MGSEMIIFGAILISVLTAIILLMFFKENIVWWELVLIVLIPTLLSFGSKALVESISANFTEYWGDEVAYVYEREPYNEWVSQTCTREVYTGTDSKGNSKYRTETYDCSYQNDVGPRWYSVTKLGENIGITEKTYDKWNVRFGNKRSKTRTRRNYSPRDRANLSSNTKFAGTKVGNESYLWRTSWDGAYETQIPVTTKHKYENKIKASDYTVFNYIKVTDEVVDSMKLFDYPVFDRNYFNYPAVLGYNNKKVQKAFQKLNGKLGNDKQVRVWVLIHKNIDNEIGYLQESYWVGGNKNEIVINIGVDETNKIVWSHIFTWSNSAGMVDNIKQYIEKDDRQLNEKEMLDIADYTLDEVGKRFERLEFTQFDYLTVEPPLWAVIMTYILTLISSIGLAIYAVKNDIDADGNKRSKNYYRRY